MERRTAEVLEQALELSETERAELAGSLLLSLESEDLDAEELWDIEIRRRAAELDAGTVQTLSLEEVEEALRQRFG